MRYLIYLSVFLLFACKNRENSKENTNPQDQDQKIATREAFNSVKIEPILENDSLSIRAIEIIGNNLAFAGNNGSFGLYNSATGKWNTDVIIYEGRRPEFRAVASTANDFFMLSVSNPALLYKTGDQGKMELVYKEEHPKVFYDAMAFWNDQEGIAMGDPTDGCLSIIITRNGGHSWEKVDCGILPQTEEGEAAFAASNSNIAVQGEETWILSGGMKSRIFYSPDKGQNWEVFDIPLSQGEATSGGYSLDFYDSENGIMIGGDYTKPEDNSANKAITTNGGKTWQLIGKNEEPGYKSSVRYVPNSNAQQMVATGFTGISYSKDAGKTWKQLTEEGFFTIRFLNDSIAYAAGKGRIAKIHFK